MTIRLDRERIIVALQQELKRQGIDCQLNEERVQFVERENHGYEKRHEIHYVEIYVPDLD